MDLVKLWKPTFKKFEVVWSALGRTCTIKLFKDCLPQILLGPSLNTLPNLLLSLKIYMYTKLVKATKEIDYRVA